LFVYQLDHFDMTVLHDQAAILPFIRAAIDSISSSDIELRLLATPWSPPAWMKVPRAASASDTANGTESIDIQSMLGSAQPNGLIDSPQVHRSWANYISRFIEAYSQQGVPIWAVTPQNEPLFAAPWEVNG
jgi:glucosylceramidase